MSLFLVESNFNGLVNDKDGFTSKVSTIQEEVAKADAHLIEVQVSKDFSKVFFIFETDGSDAVTNTLTDLGLAVDLVKEVRLVGKDLEEVKKQAEKVNYLVEWNLPAELTMEKYLDRKKTNSVHYDEVPEVAFSRTYVCEDMTKCLCFYDAPDEAAVKRAREAVKAPIDSISEIFSDK